MRELPAAEQDLCLLDVSLRKPPKRRLWRKQQGGFEEVSQFSMPQRGWKLADTTVNLSAAIGRKLPAGGTKRLLGKVGRRRQKRKELPESRGRQHTIDEQGQVHLPSMVTTGEGERLCLSPSPDLLKRYLFQRTPPGMSVISTPMAFRSSRMRSASVKSLAFLAS